jgi:hypothetical protein
MKIAGQISHYLQGPRLAGQGAGKSGWPVNHVFARLGENGQGGCVAWPDELGKAPGGSIGQFGARVNLERK